MSNHKTLNDWLTALNQYKIDLGLERLQQVLKRLNLNQLPQTIITVGGTNGKGSTVAALSALLSSKSISYGAFTSPHIFKFNERININGQLADDEALISAFEAIEAARGEINLSYFEFAFLAAVLLFKNSGVDVILLEVGLGGRLDAANVLDAHASIITTVDIDHTEWLGDDIETIATEKAGILREQQVSVYGDEPTPQAIKNQAAEVGANLIQFNKNYQLTANGEVFSYQFGVHVFSDLGLPPLKGDWQVKNFASALTALLGLQYSFGRNEIQQALADMKVAGRLETIQDSPQVLADVAHNKQAVANLSQWLKEHPVEGRTRAVFSVLKDKQLVNWLSLMDEVVDHWFIFELNGERAMDQQSLLKVMTQQVTLISQFDSAKSAYQTALQVSEKHDRIIVFGSFHVLDEVLQ